ncbi:MAG TPA: cytochrome c [Terracidiphilus sp.]|nr:cytochrome c [Terracidiphilus sp.]
MLKPLVLLSAAFALAAASTAVAVVTAQEAQNPPEMPAVAPTGPMAPDAVNPVTPTAATLAAAKVVYGRDCALCHGDNGDGKSEIATSMDLKLDDWTKPDALAGKHDGQMFDIIRMGMGKMPDEEKGRASDVEVWNMIHYIRSLSQAPSAAAAKAN